MLPYLEADDLLVEEAVSRDPLNGLAAHRPRRGVAGACDHRQGTVASLATGAQARVHNDVHTVHSMNIIQHCHSTLHCAQKTAGGGVPYLW